MSETAASRTAAPGDEDCWSSIGFAGDESCPELARLGHCHNCRVFITASRALFEDTPPDGYEAEWTKAVALAKREERVETQSLVVFRLAGEVMAFPTASCEEISDNSEVHLVPHLSGGVFLGLVNLRGRIELAFSLAALMGLSDSNPGARLIAVRQHGEIWVFPVDEILSIHRMDPAAAEEPPATLGPVSSSFTTGILHWGDERIDVLDPDLIVRELARRFR